MKPMTRRDLLKGSMAAGAAFGAPGLLLGRSSAQAGGANDEVRLAVVGLGDMKAIGGVGARGHQLIGEIRKLPGVRITALCDVDSAFLDREKQALQDYNKEIKTHKDLRRVFDDKDIDAVVIATPNHWHALATVWACQAGKDVFVEKPFSHDIWEGRQMVAAARKYDRMVQVGTQNRSNTFLRDAFKRLKDGRIGEMRFAHAIIYRPREGIGKVDKPTPPPSTVDYDLWCGPIAKGPINRRQLHYEWHWFWDTGNGEMGNNGIHVIDICRLAMDADQIPPRAVSIGGRFGVDDCAETANTHIALFDYQPVPLICEVRNFVADNDRSAIGKFRNRTGGVVLDFEGGYFAGDGNGGAIYDHDGKKIEDLPYDGSGRTMQADHLANFLSAVRSRKRDDLNAEALIGHQSTACCHLANVSHRLGKTAAPDAIRASIKDSKEFTDAFNRCRDYLRDNGVNLDDDQATLGPLLTYDPKRERFTGDFADEAEKLSRREYREPFVVPEIAS